MLGTFGFFFSKKLGTTLKKKKSTPNIKDEHAIISQVLLKPYVSFKYPPRIGAIIHPIAYAVLNNPAALSFNSALSPRPSFS